jgi:ribonuclease-3
VVFRDEVLGVGSAGSKKEAEQRAAAAALKNIDTQP